MKKNKFVLCLVTMFILIGSSSFPLTKGVLPLRVTEDDKKPILPIDSAKADTVVKYIYKAIGTKYVWAGSTPSGGFDCSGLLYWAYKKVGFTVIRSSRGLATMGIGIDSADATHGDVILFKGTNANTTGVGHVGVVVSKKGERLRFIHASSAKKHMQVVETTFGGSYYVKRYLGIRRVLGVLPTDTTQKK
jgi:cell wall-associated NlpC family hydrolase